MAVSRQQIEQSVRKMDKIAMSGNRVVVLKDIAGKIEINALKKTITISPTEIGTTKRYYGIPYSAQDIERFEKEYGFCPTPDDDVEIFDGKIFDLKDPHDLVVWNWAKYSDVFAASIEDIGASMEAQFYPYQETIEADKQVTKVEKYFEAIEYIKEQSLGNLINLARLFNNRMENRKPVEIKEYLYDIAKDTPDEILRIKDDDTVDVKLFFYRALDANYIKVVAEGGFRIHYTQNASITLPSEDACIAWLMDHKNAYKRDMLQKSVDADPDGQNMTNAAFPPSGNEMLVHNPFPTPIIDNEDISGGNLSFDEAVVVEDESENASGSADKPSKRGGSASRAVVEQVEKAETELQQEKKKTTRGRRRTNIKS